MAAAASFPISTATDRRLRLAPTLPDLFFALILMALFGQPSRWQALLGDGDTGWHIRTGEYILAHGIPTHDSFSFSRAGKPWFAWEWLSEVILAQTHRWWGLEGVAALGVLLVCLAAALLFAWMLRRGAGAWIALAMTLAASSAASVHYLARPHLFSLVLWVAGLWILDEDRACPTPWLWTLAPLAGLWANLHGGFAAWLGTLGLLTLVSAAQRNGPACARYGSLTVLSSLATLINPYGWQLHRHILGYLSSSWIVEHVAEFQSPQIRSENMVVFAGLLLAGVAVAAKCWRSHCFEAILVALWGFAALRSARYVPLFAVVAAPLVAWYLASWWARRAECAPVASATRVLWESAQALGTQWRPTVWAPLLAALAMLAVFPAEGLADFPQQSFPVEAVRQNGGLWSSPAGERILTSDQWGDYLIYRLYPRTHVFFDGRSDFYGEAIGEDYRILLAGGRNYRQVMTRYGFTAALLPLDWPLGQILERDPDWRAVYRDRQAVLLVRSAP
jgi:hypothetical protein